MLHKDDWLSGYFDKGAYIYKPPFSEHSLPDGFTFAKIPAEDIQTAHKLGEQGFKIVETLVQCVQEHPVKRQNTPDTTLRPTIPEDEDAVAAIARNAFTFSRLYKDPDIPNETAAQIKEDWVRNFYRGQRGDSLIVATREDRIAGFLLLIGTTIDLIATAPHEIRKGTAAAMIAAVNTQTGLLQAGTQIINTPSLALYRKCGFTLKRADYVLHRHGK